MSLNHPIMQPIILSWGCGNSFNGNTMKAYKQLADKTPTGH